MFLGIEITLLPQKPEVASLSNILFRKYDKKGILSGENKNTNTFPIYPSFSSILPRAGVEETFTCGPEVKTMEGLRRDSKG